MYTSEGSGAATTAWGGSPPPAAASPDNVLAQLQADLQADLQELLGGKHPVEESDDGEQPQHLSDYYFSLCD